MSFLSALSKHAGTAHSPARPAPARAIDPSERDRRRLGAIPLLLTLGAALGGSAPAAASTCETAPPDLAAHYRFDGDVTDASAAGVDGTVIGGVGFVPGVCGQAADFDGVDDAVAISSSAIGALDVFTVSLWMRVDTYTPGQSFVLAHDRQNGDAPPNKHFDLRVGGVGIFSGWESSAGTNAGLEDPLFSANHGGDWVHVAMTRDAAGDGALWVDGVVVDTTIGAIETTNPDDWLVGAIRSTAFAGSEQLHFDGAVDELRIFGRALQGAEIAALARRDADPGVVWAEDFVGETGLPTTPEIDHVGVGSLVETPSPFDLLDFVNDRLRIGNPFPFGQPWRVFMPDDRSLANDDVVFRTRREIQGFTDSGDALLGHVVALSPETYVLSWLTVLGAGSPFPLVVIETRSGDEATGESERSAVNVIPVAIGNAIVAGAPWDLETRIDRATWTATTRLSVANERFDSEPVPLFGPPESVITFFADYASNRSGAVETVYDLRRAEIAGEPEGFAPFLNLDIGQNAGTPPPSYAAAGGAGPWNTLGLDPVLDLVDVDGQTTTASADVFAVSQEGPIEGSNAMLGDHLRHCSVSNWRIDVDGVPDGPVRVLVYAPDGASTGAFTVNDAPGDGLVGLPGNALVQGDNWDALRSVVIGGQLTIEEQPGGTCTAVAGIQIETPTPLPEPGFGLGLALGLPWLLDRRRRRRPERIGAETAADQ